MDTIVAEVAPSATPNLASQAMSGMMSITGTEESGPVRSGTTVVDYLAGFSLTVALVTALYQRERTGLGRGQRGHVRGFERSDLGRGQLTLLIAGEVVQLIGR